MRQNLGIAAWLPNDVDPAQAERLIDDPMWMMQEKADGRRAIVYGYEDGTVVGTNREGDVLATPLRAEVVRAFADVPRPFVLDCEDIHQGPIALLDAIMVNGSDIRKLAARVRWDSVLATATRLKPPAEVIRCAFTAAEKIELLETLRSEYAEGVVFKSLDAKYTPGRPAVGGSFLRWKFRSSLDALIFRPANDPDGDGKAHFYSFLYDRDGELVELGTVNAASFFGRVPIDQPAVAEISFLYSTPNGRLVQPVIVRLRTDKKPRECTTEQLNGVLGGKFRRRYA